jgi:hypothetical protein
MRREVTRLEPSEHILSRRPQCSFWRAPRPMQSPWWHTSDYVTYALFGIEPVVAPCTYYWVSLTVARRPVVPIVDDVQDMHASLRQLFEER